MFFFFCTSLPVGKTNVYSVSPFHDAHSSVRYSEYNGSKMNTFVSNLQSMQPAKMPPSMFNCMFTLHVGRVGPVNFYPKIYLPNACLWTVGGSQSSRKRTHSNPKTLCEATAARMWNCIFVFYLVWWGCSLTTCEHIVSSVTYQK